MPIISYARHLRKNPTKAEKFLWRVLRNRRFHGYKFRRQHPVSNIYILDFYCEEKKLAIELDGQHHLEELQIKYDDDRSHALGLLGIKVIRFSNDEVLNKTRMVLRKIFEYLSQKSFLD